VFVDLDALAIGFVRYYEDYEIDEVKGLSNLTQMYIEVILAGVLMIMHADARMLLSLLHRIIHCDSKNVPTYFFCSVLVK